MSQKQKMKNTMKIISDAVRMMWRLDRVVVICTVLWAVMDAALPFVGIYLSAYVLDGLQAGMDGHTLLRMVGIAVTVVFLLTVLADYNKEIWNVHVSKCTHSFDMEMSRRTLAMDYELLDSPLVNEIRARIYNNSTWGSGFASAIWDFSNALRSILELGIAVVVLVPLFVGSNVFRDISALLLVLGFFVVVFLSVLLSGKTRKKLYEVMQTASAYHGPEEYFLSRIHEYKQGKDIRTYGGQKLMETYLNKSNGIMAGWMKIAVGNMSLNGFVTGMASGLLQIFAYLFVVFRAAAGALAIGSLLKYAATIYRFSTALTRVISEVSQLAMSAKRQQATMEYMNIEDVLYKGSLPVEKRFFCEDGDNDYEIEFRNVSFRYPGSEKYVLKNFSFKFRTGERLAVVGMNGSGKTTFIKLLCRLYDPTEGEILLNGIDIRKYDYREYMTIFSVVFQDFKIFAFSIAQNVAASLDYDRAKVESCLIKAGFGERLAELPEAAEIYLYKNFDKEGVEISGGEAQKIALARALYKDAPFIILDEPTAALDPVAEFEIYSRFNEIIGKKTAIYISHRLSSCRFCDDIAVFHEGCLVQRGSHEELSADREGKYYELWQAQARYY